MSGRAKNISLKRAARMVMGRILISLTYLPVGSGPDSLLFGCLSALL